MSARLLIIFLLIASVGTAQTTIVYFEFGSADLTSEARTILNKLVASKKINAIGLNGHTDQMGSEEYNEWLSVQRALSVKKYLLSKGLDESKISVVRGFGAQRLISDKLDDLSRQLNRRVVLSNNYTPTELDLAEASRQSNLEKPTLPDTSKSVNTSEVTAKADVPKKVVPPKVEVAPKIEVVQEAEIKEAPVAKKEAPVVKQQQNEKLIEDIQNKNTKAGENIALKNINFYEGSHEFLPSSSRSLNDLLETMQKVPTLEIEIQGHVCCQDGDMDGMDVATGELSLSVNRAKAVYDFLAANGIDKSRLGYKGLAHKFPIINIEVTEDDRIVNRRVEIKIIKK